MINFKINEIEYELDEKKEDLTVLQACLKYGIEIPRFCYHEKLTIAGNCRMCLVYVTNNEKLIAACGITLDHDFDDEKICTEVDEILRAREGVIEFLLINHPLDCPICDQGGECDLQDQTMLYGLDTGRFYIKKRAVDVKNFGLIIKAIMTRCIHCTRCVRFLTEIVGIYNLGVLGRGYNMEIGTYSIKNNIINSEVSGNIIDLCPVGALTSQMYAYKGRSWELKSLMNIDIFDSLLTSINFQVKGNIFLRILPKINDDLNEEWITDKVRFHYDSYKLMNETRIKFPKYKLKIKKYITIDWKIAMQLLFQKLLFLRNKTIIFGSKLSHDTLCFYKYFFNYIGLNNYIGEYHLYIKNLNFDFRENFLNKNLMQNLELNDLIFLCGLNLRVESPLLNLRLRNLNFKEDFVIEKKILILGNKFFWRKDSIFLGSKLNTFLNILEGRHFICKQLISSKNPLILYGYSLLNKLNLNIGKLKTYLKNCLNINRENILLISFGANSNMLCELGIHASNIQKLNTDLFYCIENNDIQIKKIGFFIYQGILTNKNFSNIDLYLPSKFYFEDKLKLINIFGKYCESQVLNYTLNSTIKSTKLISLVMLSLIKKKSFITKINNNFYLPWQNYSINFYSNKEILIYKNLTLNNLISDFYLTDTFIKNSLTLQNHRLILNNFKNNFKNDN